MRTQHAASSWDEHEATKHVMTRWSVGSDGLHTQILQTDTPAIWCQVGGHAIKLDFVVSAAFQCCKLRGYQHRSLSLACTSRGGKVNLTLATATSSWWRVLVESVRHIGTDNSSCHHDDCYSSCSTHKVHGHICTAHQATALQEQCYCQSVPSQLTPWMKPSFLGNHTLAIHVCCRNWW